ncbi:caffeoylshikimate esterase-like isoform X2 [Durio zibethinus]|uniref:Caffeoylshikimate esterase-like isoform X2 n=1 Tax=Durio zibethinus TaxID=66656 RepID=A0A6P6B4K2_DURZI|nr:caffeoylshikimate esterase-like isoform X2 [Durio zibethinus]
MALKTSNLFRSHLFYGFLLNWRRGKSRVMAKPVRFKGVDEELQKILDTNMDEAPARRRAREAFKDIQLGINHILFKTPPDGLKMKESYEVNSRGLEIFSKSWLPENSHPKAMVFFCHGYGDTCTFFFEGIARKLASCGYGVFAMDYPGFGLSEGLHCYIPSFDRLVDDVIEQYSKVKENPDFRALPNFLFGQSMGGAVALKMHLKQPNAWSGACVVAPMCKIADEMVPPWIVKQILIGVANILPKQKLVPQKDLAEAAFRDNQKRELTPYNVIAYKDKPRLRTALEMLRTTDEIEQNLEKGFWILQLSMTNTSGIPGEPSYNIIPVMIWSLKLMIDDYNCHDFRFHFRY